MTPDDRASARLQRRLDALDPAVRAAVLRAIVILVGGIDQDAIARLIASGAVQAVLESILSDAQLDRAFAPVRSQIRSTMERSFKYAVKDIPGSGKINGVLAVRWDYLSPDVIVAIRALESAVLDTFATETRETVRAFVENGLRDGRGAASVARELRSVIGMPANGVTAAANFRAALESGDVGKALGYRLRDARFDASIRRLASAPLSAEKIESMVAAYERRFVARNALTVAKTATLSAYKAAHLLAWRNAQDIGAIPAGYQIIRRWIGIGDTVERAEHFVMNDATTTLDAPYSNGDHYPGEQSPWNCRCTEIFRVVRI